MAREVVFMPDGHIFYQPDGSDIASRIFPAAGLTPSGIWLPFALDANGNLRITQGPPEREVSTAALSAVPASTSSVQVLPSNPNRNGLIVYNNSNASCFLAFAASSSTGLFSELLDPGSTYEMPEPIYTGVISAIWTAANGQLQVTEF